MSDELIYGFHPVREALRSRPESIRKLWVSARGKRLRTILQLAERSGVEVASSTAAEIETLLRSAGTANPREAVHNGVLAAVRELQASSHHGGPGRDTDLVVLLEDVQDPRNLGAILRVCEGAGVGRVLVRDRGSAPISPVVVKASAGAAEVVPWERVTNTANELERLKGLGYWCWGADAGGRPPWEVDLDGPLVLCLGGEQSGLRQRTRGLCDGLVGLPMRGRVASLNVATAAAALLYEAVRQRTAAAKDGR